MPHIVRHKLYINSRLTHGLSETYPKIILPTVLAIPIIARR